MADELSLSSSASYANSWISWFLASKGNEYFCEVDDEYIIDRFNLTGLNQEVQGYSAAIELITDTAADQDLNDEQREQLEASARHLYGLIHARFIITSRGLAKMASPSRGFTVKLYCPRCEDLYSPKSSRHGSIDGAYFGSTFAHMLFMVYPGMIPSKSVPGAGQGSGGQAGLGAGGLGAQSAAKVERVRPRIFGFQVHEHAKLLRWQERVRDQQIARLEQFELDAQLE
ncbi:casein kinase 2 regulatory subunit [Rhodotorula mucilaginosa]|uniref:Casein kinase II subunit beta n=1 Tax=Rhodotorula mucilaginosa TaxID=5537 RepID=A0A9P6WAC1_RHOMI|nr:casein kinase 2 regulatory subunit [Rhodotorula mucilaginosa]